MIRVIVILINLERNMSVIVDPQSRMLFTESKNFKVIPNKVILSLTRYQVSMDKINIYKN